VAKAAPVAAPNGRPRKGAEKVDNVKVSQGGNSATYLAAKLKRDHPAIAEAMEAGKYRSVRAAARAAGIVKDVPLLERVLRMLARFRIDCMRKAGQLLRGTVRRGGSGGSKAQLEPLGVERLESQRWQRLARIAEQQIRTASSAACSRGTRIR
jgi:hypothetical protein